MTSCLDGNDGPVNTASMTYSPVFNTVTNLATGESFHTPDNNYQLLIDYNAKTLSMSQSMFQLSSTDTPGALALNNLSYRFSQDGSMFVSTPAVQDVVSSSGQHTVTDCEVTIKDRFIDEMYSPLIHISYTVDNTHLVTVTPQTCYYFGKLTSVNKTTGESYVHLNVAAVVTFEPRKGTASINLKGIKFVNEMPRALDMLFPGISFSTNVEGYKLACESLIPTINKDPFPSYPITNLTASANLAKGTMPLEFDCHPKGMDEFHVTIDFQPARQELNN